LIDDLWRRHDEAQLRFSKTAKLSENFYVRQDGTCSYFFSEEELRGLAAAAGLEVEECYAIRRQYANRQQRKMRRRVWMHAKLRKPDPVLPAAVPTLS
jgi:methyltransferase-like protein 6